MITPWAEPRRSSSTVAVAALLGVFGDPVADQVAVVGSSKGGLPFGSAR